MEDYYYLQEVIMRNRFTTMFIATAMASTIIWTAPASTMAGPEKDKEEYNEFGIKYGTEVYGIDISKFNEEQLQYVPEGWRDGKIESEHPHADSEEKVQLNSSYPDVNNYIKQNKLPIAKQEDRHLSFLPKFTYRNGLGGVEGVVAHETANPNSTIEQEISWMSRNYKNAFVHAFVDHNHIIEVHPTDYAAWGAGPVANQRFVHVELVEVKTFDQFARSIQNYTSYIASVLVKYDLGVTSAESSGKGSLWSHRAVSKWLGGTTHVDPHGYFAKYGYKYSDFVKLVKEKYQALSLERLAGDSRYSTAVEVSKAGWNKATNIVLARGDDYADALAGVSFAQKYKAPLLLTQSHKLTAVTEKEIKRLGAKNVYILGGDQAVNSDVEKKLNDMGLYTRRLAGRTREETAVEIAKDVWKGKDTKEAAIVNGYMYPDALSIAPYAAQKGMPVLLVQPNKYSKATKEAVIANGVRKTTVVGGPLAVSDKVYKQLPNPTRIEGKDRFTTAVKVTETFHDKSKEYFVTTGLEFPDALTSAALASKEKTGVLLVGSKVPKAVESYFKQKSPNGLTIVGGLKSVSGEIELDLSRLIK